MTDRSGVSEKKITNTERIEAVEWWQSCEYLHPLTCAEHSNTPLKVVLLSTMNRPLLICETNGCDYVQEIPKHVTLAYFSRANGTVKNQKGT